MKKVIVFLAVIALLVAGLLLPAAAVAGEPQSQSGGMMFPLATGMFLDGTWVILDENMTAPAFFSGGPWTWDSELPVKFTITDLYVVTDIFKVYDGSSFVIQTPYLPDWDVLGSADPFDPPWTSDPDAALASGYFSSAVICFASGSHSIDIEDIHIPPVSVGGPPFPDGTVAFKAERLTGWPIDIKPWSDPNSINLKSKGVVPVAVLTTDLFDAATVDPDTVLFAGASPVRWTMEDVDGDGDMDLLFHFKTQELGLAGCSTEATLTGNTYDGGSFTGTDSVNIVKA